MDELTNVKPARPMDRNLMGNDSAMVRNLVGLLNDPNITGAVVPPEEKMTNITAPAAAMQQKVMASVALQAQQSLTGTPLMPQTPHQKRERKAPALPQPTQVQAPADTARHAPAQKIFFTGHAKVGKNWLADQMHARVFEFEDPIYNFAASAFGQIKDPSLLDQFVADVVAWGEGFISANYPLTPARALFCDYMHESGPEGDEMMGIPVSTFGTPGFWAKSLIARVSRFLADPKKITVDRVVVTNVRYPSQYHTLQSAGFRAYHVMCHNNTRAARGADNSTANAVASSVEQNVTTKVSQQRSGDKLWCIWNDDKVPMPSARLMTVQEFLDAYK